MRKRCPFRNDYEVASDYLDCVKEECELYKKSDEGCIFQSIDNKLGTIISFQQSLIDLSSTIKSIDDWLNIMANLMKKE